MNDIEITDSFGARIGPVFTDDKEINDLLCGYQWMVQNDLTCCKKVDYFKFADSTEDNIEYMYSKSGYNEKEIITWSFTTGVGFINKKSYTCQSTTNCITCYPDETMVFEHLLDLPRVSCWCKTLEELRYTKKPAVKSMMEKHIIQKKDAAIYEMNCVAISTLASVGNQFTSTAIGNAAYDELVSKFKEMTKRRDLDCNTVDWVLIASSGAFSDFTSANIPCCTNVSGKSIVIDGHYNIELMLLDNTVMNSMIELGDDSTKPGCFTSDYSKYVNWILMPKNSLIRNTEPMKIIIDDNQRAECPNIKIRMEYRYDYFINPCYTDHIIVCLGA